MSFEREAALARDAALAAGEVIARHAAAGRRSATEKSHDNPVTAADLEANAAIGALLHRAFPHDAILSEESAEDPARLGASRVWVVDPLDGTKEFVEGVPQFAVSVALVVAGRPVAACVYQPTTRECFHARRGGGAWLGTERLAVSRTTELAKCALLASRTELKRGQLDAWSARVARVEPIGSAALKLALVAAGRADVWLSVAPKTEWDVCAGDLLVHEAGGAFRELARGARAYNQAQLVLAPPLAAGSEPLLAELERIACED